MWVYPIYLGCSLRWLYLLWICLVLASLYIPLFGSSLSVLRRILLIWVDLLGVWKVYILRLFLVLHVLDDHKINILILVLNSWIVNIIILVFIVAYFEWLLLILQSCNFSLQLHNLCLMVVISLFYIWCLVLWDLSCIPLIARALKLLSTLFSTRVLVISIILLL